MCVGHLVRVNRSQVNLVVLERWAPSDLGFQKIVGRTYKFVSQQVDHPKSDRPENTIDQKRRTFARQKHIE